MNYFSSAWFTHDAEQLRFIAEVSDLIGRLHQPYIQAIFGRLYNDACDIGIVMISDKTGQEATFYLKDEVYNDGELVEYILKPTNETLRKFPRLEGYEVVILND